ncbi:oligosaccharide flippase family protein [Pontiellaceae bacterium B12227]|nr:oligosaccharide flippase family protein [Pontiellaceae bacterium B12227]
MNNDSQREEKEGAEGAFFSREAVGSVPWMLFGKVILFFVYFGISMLTVNGLGKEKFGIYSLMTNISSYMLVLCGLGLGSALMRYVPELTARKNRMGLLHLMWKSITLQLLAVLVISAILLALCDPLQRLFNAGHVEHFRFYLKLACGLTALLLMKDFVGTVFTSIYKTRMVAILSITHGLGWFCMLFVWLYYKPEVGSVFFVQMLSVGLVYSLGAVLLFKHVYGLPWKTNERGIGSRRTLSFSGTIMLSTILRMVMFKYSEVFFIAAVGGTTLAGIYDLGYTIPYTAVTFLPLALLPLFTSAFAEAYVRDHSCLGKLISSYYKLLMMVSLPIGILGAFFAPQAYHVLYSGQMGDAGGPAAAFCIVLMLPLISMPLSAAIKAKEKVLNMVPMLVLQIVVNLILDWLLIVYFRLGVWGGIAAVAGTFALTIPFRLAVVRGILGGVYFPVRFFLRITVALVLLAWAIKSACNQLSLFQLTDLQWINIGLLFLVGAIYLVLFALSVRHLRLVRNEDIEDFHALEIDKLNKVLRYLVK